MRRTRESGFDHHLVKPVDAGALLELLSRFQPREQNEDNSRTDLATEPVVFRGEA